MKRTIIDALKRFAAWIKSKLPSAKAAAAPVVAEAQSGIEAFNDNVEDSFIAVRANRRGWLFTGLLVLAVALGAFFAGHGIATRGVLALKIEIVTLKDRNLALNAQAKTDAKALAMSAADLESAAAEIQRLGALVPKAETPPAPAKPKKAKPVKAGWP